MPSLCSATRVESSASRASTCCHRRFRWARCVPLAAPSALARRMAFSQRHFRVAYIRAGRKLQWRLGFTLRVLRIEASKVWMSRCHKTQVRESLVPDSDANFNLTGHATCQRYKGDWQRTGTQAESWAFCPEGFVIHLERLLLVILSIAAMNSSHMIPT